MSIISNLRSEGWSYEPGFVLSVIFFSKSFSNYSLKVNVLIRTRRIVLFSGPLPEKKKNQLYVPIKVF